MSERFGLQRLHTGVPGLDEILGGGLPEYSFNLIAGTPGSGKTTLAHQLMFGLACQERTALYFTVLGEPPLKMLRYQQQFSFFDVEKVNRSVRFVNLAQEMSTGDFERVLERIRAEVEGCAAGLVFVDSFRSVASVATAAGRGDATLQEFVQRLGIFLTSWQATTFLVGEYDGADSGSNPVFTVADGILWLATQLQQNSAVRKIRVAKMRGQASLPGLHSFRIGMGGLEVFPRILSPASPAGTTPGAVGSPVRVATGVPALDEMMGGGLPQGHSLLVSGPSGAGKTTLAAAFLAEGARRGEKGILTTFEHTTSQARNAMVEQLVRDGMVTMVQTPGLDVSIDEILHALAQCVRETGADRVVIDSLSGLELAMAPPFRQDFRESVYRVVGTLTAAGATVLLTTEMPLDCGNDPLTAFGASFLTDAIVVQRYHRDNGRMVREIGVHKMRTSDHSSELRPFRITGEGIVID